MLIARKAKAVLKKLNKNGIEAYIVGGAVRDFCLKIKPHDYDMCYNGTPNDIKEIFKDHKIYEIGIKYGTLTLDYKGLFIEITPFRTEEGYNDRRHPKTVKFVSNLKEDLSRRDFTINALALDKNGKIIDMFEGLCDLKNGVIKAVGDPKVRFKEDALRMLRAIRFASRFGFTIESGTKTALIEQKESLKSLSKERISEELKQIINSKSLKICIDEFSALLKVLNKGEEIDNDYSLNLINKAPKTIKFPLFVMLYKLQKSLCLSGFEEKWVQLFIALKTAKNIDVIDLFLNKNEEEVKLCFWYLKATKKIDEKQEKIYDFITKNRLYKQINNLKIDGNDLMNFGFCGKEISQKREEICRKILSGELKNNRKKLLKYLNKKA